jgi:A/G-specific adenine glycosylase
MIIQNKNIHKKLLAWYDTEGRHTLPWRLTENIYHIYLSEIMLQQTQVNRVRDEYYPQFLRKFPSLKILADASQDEVLAAWSGLGYYSRARNLHKTAKLTQMGLPKEEKELLKLPGIGRYTASAICSFGYAQAVPVVDTNIARVLKRYFALLDVKESKVWEYATELLNTKEPRAHNLALMDLGSMVCLVKNPKCEVCPLKSGCMGQEDPQIYTQKRKTIYESLELYYGVCIRDEHVALHYATEKMYKGMLLLPKVEPIEENYIASFKHSYTKYRIDVHLYSAEEFLEEIIWVHLSALKDAPISSLIKKAQKYF